MEKTRSLKPTVEALLQAAHAAGHFPGCVAGWSRGERSTIVAVGRTSLSGRPQRSGPAILYDLASLTKPLVVGSLFLVARRTGDLDEHTPIGSVLPEIRRYRDRTVGAFLTHTSGLPAWDPLYAATPDPDSAAAAIDRLDPIAPPGARVEYSCLGFILLGRAMERIFGEELDSAFARLVAEPLELRGHLGYRPGPAGGNLAGGARMAGAEQALLRQRGLDDRTIPPWRPGLPDDGNARFLRGVAGNAGLFGTVEGVLRLAREFRPGGGRLFSAEEADCIGRLRTDDHASGRTFGWQRATTPGCSAGPALSPMSFGHVGFTGTSVWIDPLRDCVLVLLSNRHHPGHRLNDLHPLRRRFHTVVVRGINPGDSGPDVGHPIRRE